MSFLYLIPPGIIPYSFLHTGENADGTDVISKIYYEYKDDKPDANYYHMCKPVYDGVEY